MNCMQYGPVSIASISRRERSSFMDGMDSSVSRHMLVDHGERLCTEGGSAVPSVAICLFVKGSELG